MRVVTLSRGGWRLFAYLSAAHPLTSGVMDVVIYNLHAPYTNGFRMTADDSMQNAIIIIIFAFDVLELIESKTD